MLTVTRLTTAGLAAACVALLGLSGCGDIDEASASPLSRDDLITETADQLAAGANLTYSAKYQVAGGETATVNRAQRPLRSSYVYPGGRLIVTTTVTVKCTGSTVCDSRAADPAAAATLNDGPLISPEAAQAMLATAALDPIVDTKSHDTTIAGRHATCLLLDGVDGTPAKKFDLCVTNEGVLASFTATIDGVRIDQALTAYAEELPSDAFLVPPGAKLVDKSPR
ncbi:hypothetical protein KOI35_35350 [Actinoplanes bogorensis]|uniref:Lipoprotein n=1 Tax=Paractinoplanes bogorensis TaxID=1610840 RepID=A0ABS5YZE1_9ACTN|nr:hypothetical protein [Actinoplanes bogorensis]MBU2668801.1 hypothetical protein [Actinoplanes bogorensis]